MSLTLLRIEDLSWLKGVTLSIFLFTEVYRAWNSSMDPTSTISLYHRHFISLKLHHTLVCKTQHLIPQ